MSNATMVAEREEQTEEQKEYTQQEIDQMDTEQLLKVYKRTDDESLKWPLVLRYEHLIKSAALQIRGVYSNFAQVDDIVSEGILTLLNAIDRFDPDKGVKFETYVAKRIRGMVVDLARKQDWLPRNIRRRAREIDQAITELSTVLGRFPTDTEVAECLGVSSEKYRKDAANVALSNVLSLDALMDLREQDGYQFEIVSKDTQGQPELELQDREMKQILADSISKLRKNEQIVLSLYYEKNLNMKEIAQVMEVSEPRISQIHSHAIQKLRVDMETYMKGTRTPKERKKG